MNGMQFPVIRRESPLWPFAPLIRYLLVFLVSEFLLHTAFGGLVSLLPAETGRILLHGEGLFQVMVPVFSALLGALSLRREIRDGLASLTVKYPGRRIDFLVCYGIFALSAALFLNLFISAAGGGADSSGGGSALLHLPAALLLFGIASPAAEEAVFRLVLYGRFSKAMEELMPAAEDEGERRTQALPSRQELLAVLAVSLLFGVYHGEPWQMVYAFCMGIVLQSGLILTGRFSYTVILHGLANASVLVLSAADVYERLAHGKWAALFLAIAACAACSAFSCLNRRK